MGNIEGRLTGRRDYPLTENGKKYVKLLTEKLKDIIEIKTSNGKAPIEKRKSSEFSQYFDKIWGLLNE